VAKYNPSDSYCRLNIPKQVKSYLHFGTNPPFSFSPIFLYAGLTAADCMAWPAWLQSAGFDFRGVEDVSMMTVLKFWFAIPIVMAPRYPVYCGFSLWTFAKRCLAVLLLQDKRPPADLGSFALSGAGKGAL
jgi:hypothetical protein